MGGDSWSCANPGLAAMTIPATKLNSDPRETIGRNTVTDVSRSPVDLYSPQNREVECVFCVNPCGEDGLLGLHS